MIERPLGVAANKRDVGPVEPVLRQKVARLQLNQVDQLGITRSHLFRNTTSSGTPTCRASRMCSLVCGIGPSTAESRRMAPSIFAAPAIMFLAML